MTDILNDIWALVGEMSPYLLLGFLIAGVLHEFVPARLYTRYLSRPTTGSVVLAALFGIPLPLCSCGVIPTAMGLRREGASKGATVAFLTATPQTGVDSIAATYSLMGLPFAIIRPIAALFTAVFGGVLQNAFDRQQHREEEGLSQTAQPADSQQKSFPTKLIGALRYAFLEMMEDIGRWLVVGLVVAGLITALVPDGWFAAFQGNSLLSILFVLALSIPMYLCATGSIPIAVALMLKGLTPGAAFVLLMAGPASNMASILVIRKVLGTRSLILYLSSILVGAVAFGLGIDLLCPSEWFTSALQHTEACCHEGHAGWFSIACSIVLLLLLINALSPLHIGGHHCHCHCNDECEGDACHCHETSTTEQLNTLTFTVKGMNCNHCTQTVHDTIAALPGVTEVEVSRTQMEAIVRGQALDATAICKAVEAVGFEIRLN